MPLEMSLMQQFANPETFEALSMGERLTGATVTMCMGLGITFTVLCLLWIFIAIMGKCINAADNKAKAKEAAPAPAPAAAPAAAAPVAAAVEAPAEADNAELVAVIAAAIAAMEGKPVCDLVVRSITRTPGSTTSWSNAGIRDCIASRR